MIPDFTFGVELELICLNQATAREKLLAAGLKVTNGAAGGRCTCNACVGDYMADYGVSRQEAIAALSGDGDGLTPLTAWFPKYDGSVATRESDEWSDSLEVTTPILKGEEGLIELWLGADALAQAGALANDSCGMHVHLGVRDLGFASCRRIWLRYAAFEEKIDRMVAPSRRGNRASYTRSLADYRDRVQALDPARVATSRNWIDVLQGASPERYLKLNLNQLDGYGTIECRHHNGCKDPDTVMHWVRFLLGFFQESHRREVEGIEQNGSMWDGVDEATVEWWKQRLRDRNSFVRLPANPNRRSRRTEWYRRWA